MKVLITGASGFIGRALTPRLSALGYEVVRAVRRRPSSSDELFWDPQAGLIDPEIGGAAAVINLAGANIGRRRWTQEAKRTFMESRVEGTRLISEAIAGVSDGPRVLISSSAVGYYGDRGDELLTEQSSPGSGFRAEVCRRWEDATSAAESKGVRVVKLRTGIVLGDSGGLFPYLRRTCRVGVSPRLGAGDQFWSWVTLHDTVRAIAFALEHESVSGPINVTAPDPVRQIELAETLVKVLGRGKVVNVPSVLLETVLGRERANEVLLSSARALPQALTQAGFASEHESIGAAVSHLVQ